MKIVIKLILASLVAVCSTISFAQNKVIVVPMAGDDLKPLANIITVAKANGDFTDPVAALDSISDASASNPYLVVIAPGVYEVASTINLKRYVDVSGSGQNATVISGSISSTSRADSAVFNGAADSSIRSLTARHTSTDGNRALGFNLESDSGMIIDDVKIEVAGVGNNEGIYANGSNFSLLSSTINIRGGSSVNGVYFNSGVFNSSSNTIAIRNCAVAAGIYVNTGNANIVGNRISIANCTSTQNGIYFNSSIEGVVSGSSVDINGPSGNKHGVYSNSSSSGLYSGLRIWVEGSTGGNYGIYNNSSSNRSRITGVDILASTAAIRSSTSTSGSAGHTFISNAVLRAGLVTGEATKLHCSHVFDESSTFAPVELGDDCSV